jgi:UDP-3-O-[3-hydroxymyristoyl] glucosamine N-acyltransferase
MASPSAPRTLTELAALTGATLEGDGSVVVSRVATLEHAGPQDIAFLANPRYRGQLATTRAAAVIVAPGAGAPAALPKLVANNPYAIYAKVAAILHAAPHVTAGVHPTASIDPTARVAPTAAIGAFAVIGAEAAIGDRVSVGAHSFVGDAAALAEDVVLDARVTI